MSRNMFSLEGTIMHNMRLFKGLVALQAHLAANMVIETVRQNNAALEDIAVIVSVLT